jgi:hypothetical protein
MPQTEICITCGIFGFELMVTFFGLKLIKCRILKYLQFAAFFGLQLIKCCKLKYLILSVVTRYLIQSVSSGIYTELIV